MLTQFKLGKSIFLNKVAYLIFWVAGRMSCHHLL
jgi:hypothetical protein